ncbi:microtubule-actin cross-linking factor 1, isoforms 6/7-like isoform X4 [Littorina saxatilis]|uniref:microtubule-actin cross-linking factor 1, isoforms 6/7-like isoform X4 n=1 Tax=Littorina saxatilis TaxID=31220 RepID=UPI0038B51436
MSAPRRDLPSLDQCLSTLKKKKKKVIDGKFENNSIAVQQALDELRDDTAAVKEVKDSLHEIKKTKSHTKEYRQTDHECDYTDDLHLQRKRGLESLLYVSEIENALMGVQDDFETRALYLAQRPEVFKAVYRDHTAPAVRMHSECVSAMRESWRWLSELTTCLNTHLHNAAHYQQFCHDAQHLQTDLDHYLDWLDTQPLRADVKTKDPNIMATHLRTILQHMLDLQGRTERLCERSKLVFPVQLRKISQSPGVLKARALVDYTHREISLQKDEYCAIMDNSDPERWIVQTSDGREAEVPSIVLVIPAPDSECFDKAHSARGQMSIHWRTTAERLRGQMVQFMSNVAKDTNTREFAGISNEQKAAFMKLLNESTRQLRGRSNEKDSDYDVLRTQLVNLRKVLGQSKPGTKDIKNPTIGKWNGTQSAYQLFSDLLVYGHAYKQDVSRHVTEENMIHTDPENPPQYVSKAYFERAMPSVDIDTTTKKTQVTDIQCEMYIHEKSMTQAPNAPPRHKKGVKQGVGRGRGLEEGEEEEEEEEANFMDTTEVIEVKKNFVIVGVIDPRSQQEISVYQSINKGVLDLTRGTYTNPDTDYSISIAEAIQKGFVIVEYGDTFTNGSAMNGVDSVDGGVNLLSGMETKVCPISGVIDPRTGEWISVQDAIAEGLIDPRSGTFRNPVTGEEMSLAEAVKAGYLMAESALPVDEEEGQGVFTSVAMVDVSYKVTGVKDPRTGEMLTLEEAIKAGIIDPVKATYTDPLTGEVMSLEEAMRRGLVKGRPFDPTKDKDEGDVLTFQQLQILQQRFVPPSAADLKHAAAEAGAHQDPNDKLHDMMKDKVDLKGLSVLDPKTNREISLEEAIQKGIINLAKAEYDTLDGEILPLVEAAAQGYIEPSVLREILKTYQECSVGHLIEEGKFDPETGLVTDTDTGQVLSLETAIANGVIDPDTTFFFDLDSRKIMSLTEALDSGRFNLASGKVVDSKTGQEVTVTDAEKCGQILASIDPAQLAASAETIGVLRNVMDTKIKGIKIPSVGHLVDVEEAVLMGVLNVPNAAYAEEKLAGLTPLQLAVKSAKVEPKVATALFAAFDKLSLRDAINSGKLNAKSGKFVRPDTKQAVDLESARKSGVWNPDFVYCVDNETGSVTSLGAMMDSGKFDPKTGKVRSDKTGKMLSLEEAIAQGVLTPTIQPDKFVDLTATLKELIDSGQVNPRSATFVAPNDHRMSLRDALANGFLTLGSKVKQDPETGDVSLERDEDVVRCLVDVKENADWLTDVERALASQRKPSQRIERLKNQAEESKGLQQEIGQKEPEVRQAIQQAEQLVAASAGSSPGGQKDEVAQQVQKLKYNTSDLKLRFDNASSEAGTCADKMVHMENGLEDFYFRLEETDQWMDAAIERTQDLQTEQGSIEDQYNTFKDFMEEVKSKEDDISKLVKSADDFKDQSQDFEREVDLYRKRLQILPTISEEGETGMLDEEIESIEAKYKDISRECAKHMDRLAALVKNKKTFDDLNDKLATVYPALQEQVADIQNREFGKDPQRDARDLDALRNIKAELIGQERKLKDLTSAGERLADGLDEAGMPSEAEEVRSIIEARGDQFSALLEEIGEQEEHLDSVLTEQHNVMSRLDGVEDSIADAEDKLRASNRISLDKEKLANQLQDQRLMNADISSNKALLERLAREAHDVSGAEDRLNEVSDRLGDVERLAESRTRELEEVATGLQSFEAQASDMAHWLADSIKNMKTTTKGGSGKAQRAKVHALLEAKEERQGTMKELREICEGLMDDDRVTDKYAAKEALADMESKWNELTELLVKEVSFETVADVEGFLKYLDKAENEINTADSISVDPETLRVQLRDHNAFHDDLTQKKTALKEVIAKGRSVLHETANSKTDEIESRWDSIENQADLLCQHSGDRLRQLESALPLATHLNENLSEVEAWLEEMEAELRSQGQPGENLEEVKKQHDNLKTSQQIIDDHKLFIDDLNSTGMDLIDLCGVSEATDLHNKLMGVNNRYESLRSQARSKGRELAEKKRAFTQEAVDSLDHLLEDLDGLNRVVTGADPVPASPAKLKNEIDENKAVLEDLDRMKPAFMKTEDIIRNLKAHGVEDPGEVEDVKSKAAEIAEMASAIGKGASQRDKLLKQTLKDANQFADLSSDVLSSLRDLKDSLFSQQLPGVDTENIREQQSELAGIKTELEKAKELTGECKVHGDNVTRNCGEPGRIEIQKQLEDLGHLADDVNDMVRERGDELRKVYRHADQFAHLLDAINSWLPLSEHKLAGMRPPASDPNTLCDQIDEIKLFKSQIHPRIVEMQQLNQQLDALKDQSPVAAETLYRPVLAANDKWNEVLRGIADREAKLNEMQVKVGEVDKSMSDVIATLDQLQTDIKNQSDVNGDPKHLETILRKLQLMQSDVHNQEKTGRKLNKAVEEILKRSEGDEDSPLVAKRQLMADRLRATKAMSKDAENQLQDKMRQVKRFLGEVDTHLAAINELRQELKNNLPFGALPDTAETQYNTYVKRCQDLDAREKSIQGLLATGQQMQDTRKPEHVVQVAEKVKRLKDRWQDTRERAVKRKSKMEEHMRNVSDFHSSLKAFTDWLNSTEVSMRSFVYPSKLVDRVTKQIADHTAVRTDLQAQSERMATLDRTGTYLKHFGRKQDTIYVKNLLVGIRLRWKKILRRTDERGRLLQQACKEDLRFHDEWKELCDWLDDSSKTLNKFLNPYAQQPNLMKSDIDELKKIETIQKFQHQLQAKHPTFFATTRLGRNLKDRCTKADPERDILNNMLEELKNKWNAVRSVVTKSQNKLDEALLTSGRVSDALHSLLDWLQKAESTLADDLPVLGDLDTVHMLIEQHRNLQQELSAREPTVTTMKAPGNLPHSQNEELSQLWDRVSYLCEVRENKLTDALKLAEEFQEDVTIMREFLPEAESQLKFRSLPDDEVAIMQMIEKHEKFEEELKNHQEHVDKIKSLAEEILSSCHPNAVRFVKYYLTITQTRWDQLLERARARGERLRDTQHRLIGLAQSLEDMLAQLTEYQALLATKERDPIPHDLKVVDELLREHTEVYGELVKLSESDDFMKIMSTEVKHTPSPSQKNGSNMRLNEVGRYNPRYATLQNKWRTVSRMAIERKKTLQDAYDMLMELENFKNFDFESWRAKYLKWIQAKKFRITDFFRKQDKDGDGFLNQDEFVDGMLQSKFPTTKTELNAVFDIFDREKRGLIDYKDFVDALKPDKFRNSSRAMSDDEVIQDSIELETSSCTCRNQFAGNRIEEGKYRFGEKQKIVLVRLLNKTVMVRVGGGWVPLEEFVLNNDPCKARGRTNFDLRDQLADDSQTNQTFSPRRSSTGRISPFPATVSGKRRQNDTGYASSTSSAGSGDSSLRRSRITSSMINLSSSSNTPSSLQRNPDYGSTGNLSGQRSRTPRSSVSSGRRTPTAAGDRRRSGATTPRATTPQHNAVGFGSGVPRSRPTTPNSFSTPRRSTTPQRPSSTTPMMGRPGSITPTRQLQGSTGPTRHRKLPNAPTTPTIPTTPTGRSTPRSSGSSQSSGSQHHFPDFKY